MSFFWVSYTFLQKTSLWSFDNGELLSSQTVYFHPRKFPLANIFRTSENVFQHDVKCFIKKRFLSTMFWFIRNFYEIIQLWRDFIPWPQVALFEAINRGRLNSSENWKKFQPGLERLNSDTEREKLLSLSRLEPQDIDENLLHNARGIMVKQGSIWEPSVD